MSNITEEVQDRFRQFLIAHQLRQTRERFAILNAIYSLDGTFTIEDLELLMQERRFPVSKSAIYNTTQLLVQANLLIRHPFSSSSAVFERIVDDRPRSYQICSNCHRITRIKSKELAASLDSYRPRTFSITHRIAYIYGVCPGCQRQMRKQLQMASKSHNLKPS